MKNVSKLLGLMKPCWKKMAEFELVYRGLEIIFFAPILLMLINMSMELSGYKYITADNIYEYLKSPITIFILVIMAFAVTFFMLIEISANIYIIDQSYQKCNAGIRDILKFSAGNAIRAFSFRNIFMAIIMSLITLFLNIVLNSGIKLFVELPEFLVAVISANKYVLWIIYGLTAAAVFLFGRWLYVFHYFTLEKCSFICACRRSVNLNKKNKTKDAVVVLLMEAVLALLVTALLAGVILALTLIYKFLSSIHILYYILLAVILMIAAVFTIVNFALAVPVMYASVSVMYYRHKIEINEEIIHSEKSDYRLPPEKRKKIRKIEKAVFVTGFLVLLLYIYLGASGRINLNVEYVRTMEITAHRGASANYPENSMSAFKGAAELGADWIELDVQQTKDGEIIVMHDSSLKRTAGKNKNVWQMNYEDIEKLECGKWFSDKFAGEKIPRLQDVIEYAKSQRIKLNIELKPTGHEKNFEKMVVDIVNDNDFKDHCVITSQSYSLLRNVKEYDESINTVYVMAVAYGNILRLRAADNFSIKSVYVTEELVKRIHNSGKQLYVWTVNTRTGIDRMIDMNVDNIITDNITLAKECVYRHKTGNRLIKYLDMFILEGMEE